MAQEESLERIPNIKKLAGPADTMSLEETEQKICQFCHLWQLYADTSVELKKKSELSQYSVVAACRVYVPYMSDITRQLEEVRKIFTIEKEVRTIKNRGYFPVPHINPQEEKIETAKDKDKILERIDEIATAMIQAARQSEENLAREQEQARARDEQLRSVRQTDRSGLNFFAQANSTPVRNDNLRTDNQGVHFKTNPTRHIYSTTSDDNDPFEPPENDSIIQTALKGYFNGLVTANVQKVLEVRVRCCACVYGEMYLLLVRGVSRSKTLIPLILSQSGWIAFITIINNEQSKYIQIQIQVVYVIF